MTSNSYLIIFLMSLSLITKAQENIDTLRLVFVGLHQAYRSKNMHVNVRPYQSLKFNPKAGQNSIYRKNGSIYLKGSYIYGKDSSLIRNGQFQFFYNNNQLRDIGLYKDGKRTGTWKHYDSYGQLKFEQNHDSMLRTYFSPDGKIIAKGLMEASRESYRKHSMAYEFFNLTEHEGHWIFYDENENCHCEGQVVSSTKHGKWKYYYDYNSNNKSRKIKRKRYLRYVTNSHYEFLEACKWR